MLSFVSFLGMFNLQATLTDLPKNGDSWHAIREGQLPHMKGYSTILNSIVKVRYSIIILSTAQSRTQD